MVAREALQSFPEVADRGHVFGPEGLLVGRAGRQPELETCRGRLNDAALPMVAEAGDDQNLAVLAGPAAQGREEGFLSLVLTSVIVQVVSPWEPRCQDRRKRLRLPYA